MKREMTRHEAFEERVERAESGCWEWRGYRNSFGYGIFRHKGKAQFAHRYSYAHFVGPIPGGYAVDHCCVNRGCCNPQHLEAVTWSENSSRTRLRRTECLRGHPYDEENTYINPKGVRVCKTCRRLAAGRHRVKHEAERPQFGWRDERCKNGHPRTPENTILNKDGTRRRCRDCRLEQKRKPGGYKDPDRERPSHCPHGHELTPANTYEYGDGRYYCRPCNRAASAARR